MAGKAVKTTLKLQAPAKQITPAPPVGPALGQHGINIAEFCKQFNDATKEMEAGEIVPALITVYEDRTFSFTLGTPPASALIKKFAKVAKGGVEGAKKKIGKIKMDDIRKIAERKMVDLTSYDVESASKMIIGTAKNMGIDVID